MSKGKRTIKARRRRARRLKDQRRAARRRRARRAAPVARQAAAPAAPTIRTRVSKLTAMNVAAIQELDLASETGATFAVFQGDRASVLARVQQAVSELPSNSAARRSLPAVVRKLADQESPHVTEMDQ